MTSSPETVQNPGTYKSEPRIKIEGTGNVTLTIGTQILEVEDLDGGVIIDCKIRTASTSPRRHFATAV